MKMEMQTSPFENEDQYVGLGLRFFMPDTRAEMDMLILGFKNAWQVRVAELKSATKH
jgi:hypothetical protein